MNLLCRTKTILDRACIDARMPFRALTLAASMGLVISYGSFAISAMPVPAAAMYQDHEHQNDHDVDRHQIHSDSDGNIEVILVQDEESGHQDLLKKLKSNHKVQLHKLHSGQDGNFEVLVLNDDEQNGDGKKLHDHLVERLHGLEAGKVDHHELARQLREIADRLDGKGAHAHSKVELHQHGNHDVLVEKLTGDKNSNRRVIEFKTDAGKHVILGKTGEPRTVIIEDLLAGDEKIHVHDGGQAKLILHALEQGGDHKVVVEELHADHEENPGAKARLILQAKEHGADQNIVVEKIHVDRKHDPSARVKRFGNATTSDEEPGQDLRDLRNELQQLREEINQLRSERAAPATKRKRVIEEHKTGLHDLVSDAAIRVIDRRKKERSSNDQEEAKDLLWVEDAGAEKSGKKFLLKEKKN